jgi:TM2 domain-containing membrane protein YozV
MSDELSPTETPRAPALPAPAAERQAKLPVLAAVLTFLFPGVGQIYNGQITKAFVFFACFVGAISLSASGQAMPFAFAIPFVFLYALIDAYRSAVLINARRSGEPLESADDPASPAWGWTLVALGGVLLLNNLGWLDLWAVRRFWPVLLIVGGVLVIRSALKRREGESGAGPAA